MRTPVLNGGSTFDTRLPTLQKSSCARFGTMANDKKTALYCQKCRTPIDIDASIDQLNPAAFKLLTGMLQPCHATSFGS
jgi:hypothetical protein